MSKFCVNCGVGLEDDAMFCGDCGAAQQTPVEYQENGMAQNTQKMEGALTDVNQKQSKFGIVAFILGIISILTMGCFIIPEILGIIFGCIGIKKSSKHTLALLGLIFSIVGILILILILLI